MDLILKTCEVADFFGVSTRQVQKWGRAGCPRVKRGQWNLQDVLRWWLSEIYDAGRDETAETLQAAKTEYWSAKAQRLRFKAEREAGAIYTKDEVEKAWADRLVYMFTFLKTVAARLPPMLVGVKSEFEMWRIIEDEIHLVRCAYAEPDTKYCPLPMELKEPPPNQRGPKKAK